MDGTTFDKLVRAAGEATTRRGVLGLLFGGAASAAIAGSELASARRGGKGNGAKRCKKLNQQCGQGKKCCNPLKCKNGKCACPAGTVPSGATCVKQPPPPGCTSNAECGGGQICQGGSCVPAPPECTSNANCAIGEICQNGVCVGVPPECTSVGDCDANESCLNGTCVCTQQENGRCIRRCDKQSDCPGVCSCRNHFPEPSEFIEDGICIKEPFILCDAKTCNGDGDCKSNEICIGTGCGSTGSTVFKCSPICTLNF